MKRKLKTIKQLLEEFPDAEFRNCGNLNLWYGANSISPETFVWFGKVIDFDNPVIGNFTWDEQWFEPLPEKKKACAFVRKDGHLSWVTDESDMKSLHIINDEYTRAPEFDIEEK